MKNSITLTKINNHTVQAIPLPQNDCRPVRGKDLISDCYSNIFLCAKKKSGKTSALFHILKHTAGRDTKIIVFCSTLDKDQNWIQIRKHFEKKGIYFEGHTDLIEDGENMLTNLIEQLQHEAKESKEEEETHIDPTDMIFQALNRHNNKLDSYFQSPEAEIKPVKRRSKYLEPDYIVVFDDLSHELKSPSLVQLLKKNRHYKMRIIISSQYLHDLLPESRKQLDVAILFKGLPESKLKQIYQDTDVSIPFDMFCKLYRKATKHKFSFLYIDIRNDSYRRCFNEQFEFREPEDD